MHAHAYLQRRHRPAALRGGGERAPTAPIARRVSAAPAPHARGHERVPSAGHGVTHAEGHRVLTCAEQAVADTPETAARTPWAPRSAGTDGSENACACLRASALLRSSDARQLPALDGVPMRRGTSLARRWRAHIGVPIPRPGMIAPAPWRPEARQAPRGALRA